MGGLRQRGMQMAAGILEQPECQVRPGGPVHTEVGLGDRAECRAGRVCAAGPGTCIPSHRPSCEAASDLGCGVVRPPLSPLGSCQVRRREGLPASPGDSRCQVGRDQPGGVPEVGRSHPFFTGGCIWKREHVQYLLLDLNARE